MSSTVRKTVILAATGALVLALLPPDADARKRKRGGGRKAQSQATAPAAGLPAHPDQLAFDPLAYDAPRSEAHRHEVAGVPVYVVPDHGLPLVDVVITARGGSYLDPKNRPGLVAATNNQMRAGGAGDHDAVAFDEELDFLAVNFGIGTDDRESNASMNVLKQNLDQGLDLMFAALKSPRFQADRFDLYKKRTLQQLDRRNDATQSIEQREWRRLAYGPDHFEARQPTSTSVKAMSPDAMRAMHSQLWHPGNFIIAVAGDVEPDEILPGLEKRLKGWARGPELPPAPAPTNTMDKNVFVVNKDDVNQTRVLIGHRSTTWDHPDAKALEVMNRILGGGAFTSRITNRVRSEEGLAYSAGSVWGEGRDYPRSFVSYFQSKNESVPHAVSLVVDEIERMQEAPVSSEELKTAIDYYVESFPQRFNSALTKAQTFVDDDLWGRSDDYWSKYRDEIRAVTAQDVQRVAKEHLDPDGLTVLVVGKIEEVLAGDPDNPQYDLTTFAGEDGVLEIPLPDPATMDYPHGPRPLLPKASVEGS